MGWMSRWIDMYYFLFSSSSTLEFLKTKITCVCLCVCESDVCVCAYYLLSPIMSLIYTISYECVVNVIGGIQLLCIIYNTV